MQKKLYRSATNRVIGGVAGGLADYSGIDATIIRLLFVAVAVFSAGVPAVIFYLIAWAIMPLQPAG